MKPKLNDSMKDLLESTRAFQLPDPMKELRESMRAFQSHDSMKELLESTRAFQLPDPMKELRESMRAFQSHDSMKELLESTRAFQLPDPMKELREFTRAFQFHDTLKGFMETKAFQYSNSYKEILKLVENDTASLHENFSDFQISADGTISVGSDSIARDKLENILEQIIGNALDRNAFRLEQAVDRVIYEIKLLKDPFAQRFLAFLLYPLIVGLILSIINPLSDFYIKEALSGGNKRAIIKEVRNAITNEPSIVQHLSHLKIVTATALNVRTADSTKSEVGNVLHVGSIVGVLEKKRKWSFVEWRDESSGVSSRGWVFSRYLKNIK